MLIRPSFPGLIGGASHRRSGGPPIASVYEANGVDGVVFTDATKPADAEHDLYIHLWVWVPADYSLAATQGVLGHATSLTGSQAQRAWSARFTNDGAGNPLFQVSLANNVGGFTNVSHQTPIPRNRWVNLQADIFAFGPGASYADLYVDDDSNFFDLSEDYAPIYLGGERCYFVGSAGGNALTGGVQMGGAGHETIVWESPRWAKLFGFTDPNNIDRAAVKAAAATQAELYTLCDEGEGLVSINIATPAASIGDGVISSEALHQPAQGGG